MVKKLIIFGLIAVVIFLSVLGAVFSDKSIDGGGSSTDSDYYCRVNVYGELWGDNLELHDFECRVQPFPASIFALFQIGGDTNVKCNAYMDSQNVGAEVNLGDIGSTQERWYNFRINNVPSGSHQVTVTCQGDNTGATGIYYFTS
jgi:hypothetical protein